MIGVISVDMGKFQLSGNECLVPAMTMARTLSILWTRAGSMICSLVSSSKLESNLLLLLPTVTLYM